MKAPQPHKINADGLMLGRVATRAALFLRGKHRPEFAPNIDFGDSVVIEGAKGMCFSGEKMRSKLYRHYSAYPGGLKTATLRDRWAKEPARVIRDAVYGMLPPNRLRDRQIKRLSVVL